MRNTYSVSILVVLGMSCVGAVSPSASPTTKPAFAASISPRFPIRVRNHWGYIDQQGAVVIPPRFRAASAFGNDGFAIVYLDPLGQQATEQPGRPVIIDYRGEVVLSDDSADGLVPLGRGRFGILDRSGEVRILSLWEPLQVKPRCVSVRGPFKEGLVSVKTAGKWGFIDERGNLVIDAICDSTDGFEEGLALARSGEKWGYIDHTGHWAIKPQFSAAYRFHEGIAPVRMEDREYYIDCRGDRIINRDFDNAFAFSEGLAAVREKGSTLVGYIDKSGQSRIPAKFKLANAFREGVAYVVSAEGVAGYIDHTGRFVITLPSQSYGVSDFHNGRAPVQLDRMHGYINMRGSWVWSAQDDE